MRSLIIFLLLLSTSAFAIECEDCARKMGHTERYRGDSNHQLLLGYQYVSTWVIGKQSASYTYVAGRDWSFELEYVTSQRTVEIADFEIGKIKEDRITLFYEVLSQQ